MTANTRQTSGPAPSVEPPTSSAAAPTKSTKPSIRMAVHGPLTALHALANSYRQMMDLLKETRKDTILVLQKFTDQGYQKALDAAKDSRNALYMQAGASFVGGGLAVGGALANGLSGDIEKQKLADASKKKDFLEAVKRTLGGDDINLSVGHGAQAGANVAPPTPGTSRAMTLVRENNFDELYRCRKMVAPNQADHITRNELTDALKLVRTGALPANNNPQAPPLAAISHVDIMKNVTDQILVQSNTMNVASNDLARLDARNKGVVDLLQGVQQGGFSIGQANANEKARQEEADVAKIAQLQKMTDQAQSDFSESNKQLSRDLSSTSEQVGRIIPMRG